MNLTALTFSALTPYHHLIAGTSAGLVSTFALYPLELVKMRMQVFQKETGYGTTISSFQNVLKKEGPIGFFRGILPALVASSGSWGGYFYFYELSKKRKLEAMNSDAHATGAVGGSSGGVDVKEQRLGVKDHLMSGIEAGVMLVLIFNPIFLIKTRLALQGAHPDKAKYKGGMDAFRTIVREEGFKGLYKGLLPALFLTSHGAVQFAAYEYMKVSIAKMAEASPGWIEEKHLNSPLQPLVLGGISKMIASTVTYPYQVIKSRLQQRGEKGVYKYKGIIDCSIKLRQESGIPGFFRGLAPNLIKVAPGAALTFVIYEETLKYLRSK